MLVPIDFSHTTSYRLSTVTFDLGCMHRLATIRPVTRGGSGDTSNPPTGQKGPDFDVHFYATGAE